MFPITFLHSVFLNDKNKYFRKVEQKEYVDCDICSTFILIHVTQFLTLSHYLHDILYNMYYIYL